MQTTKSVEPIKPTWQNVADALPEEGSRVMIVSSRYPSGYPKFAVIRYHHGSPYWKLMPERMNAQMFPVDDGDGGGVCYDLWAYTGQPVNPHDPPFAQPKAKTKASS